MSEFMQPNGNITIKNEDFNKPFKLDKSFKLVKKLNDPRFGDIQLFQQDETKAVIAMKELKLSDKKHAEQEIIKCKRRMKIENQYVLPIIDYSVEKQSSLCSSFYCLKLYYEYPPTDLRNEMLARKKEGHRFSTEELLHLVYQQSEAHKHLELTKSFHGDVRPIYWGLNAGLWHSKLIYKPEEIDCKERILQVQQHHLLMGDDIYQSPMMYENLMSKNKKFDFNPNKEDMFATAMVIIELGIQDSLQDVYQKDGTFNHDAMRNHVARFEQIYNGPENQLLVTSVLTMLEPHESRRPHFILLLERMPTYYSIVKYFENLRENPSKNQERLLETFIYIDKAIIEGFTLEPGVSQVKVQEGPVSLANDAQFNTTYSNRNIGTTLDYLNGTNHIGDAKIVERIIRRFEDRDGQIVEKVEHFLVKENDKLVKTEAYEIINNKRYNVRYFDDEGKEVVNNEISSDDDKDSDKKDKTDEGKGDNSKKRMSGHRVSKSIEKHKNNQFNTVKPVGDKHEHDNKN